LTGDKLSFESLSLLIIKSGLAVFEYQYAVCRWAEGFINLI